MEQGMKSAPLPVLEGVRRGRSSPPPSPTDSVLNVVRRLTAEHHQLPVHEITATTDFFADLDDSLDYIEVIMACEEAFGIAVRDADAEQHDLSTVGKLAAYVEDLLSEQQGPARRQPWTDAAIGETSS